MRNKQPIKTSKPRGRPPKPGPVAERMETITVRLPASTTDRLRRAKAADVIAQTVPSNITFQDWVNQFLLRHLPD
jgi:hypothetical protein